MLINLNKYLSNSGVNSRRNTALIIKNGEVSVNGTTIINPSYKIDNEKDDVRINGVKVQNNINYVYIILNKPYGVISTTSDEKGRKKVTDFIKTKVNIYPVGRLDRDSTGLILLTNDGDLSHKITHPSFTIGKTYNVNVYGEVSERKLNQLRKGVLLSDGLTSASEVKILKQTKKGTLLEFIIHEGKNRQIRRMCSKVGLEVFSLKRTSIGSLSIGNLKSGEYRFLNVDEIKKLKETFGIDSIN